MSSEIALNSSEGAVYMVLTTFVQYSRTDMSIEGSLRLQQSRNLYIYNVVLVLSTPSENVLLSMCFLENE